MSESTFSVPNPLAASSFDAGHREYQLSDDLAKLCLPQEFKDSYRRLAWTNSICALFLVIGLIGLKPPKVVVRPINEPQEIVPVVFTPPEEQPKPEQPKPDEPQDQPDNTAPQDTPQVVTVVAAADPTAVAFAVPVQGAVAIAPQAHLATPPPPTLQQAPPSPITFNPGVRDGGTYPPPSYPNSALRNHEQGTAIIEIMVDASGAITSAKVFKSSGYGTLDDAALDVVKKRWRFPSGQPRWLHWPCIFQMQ